MNEYDRWKHLKGIPVSKKDARVNDLKALTAEYAKWKKKRKNDDVRANGGGSGGGRKKNGGNSKDDLLSDSLRDFENWRRLREMEAEDRG